MTLVEKAERKSTLRALAYLMLAVALVSLLITTMGDAHRDRYDFLRGMHGGLLLGAAINFLPIARWTKRNNPLMRLLDDEGAREHRRMAMIAGFWAAMSFALLFVVFRRSLEMLSGFDSVRIVATAAMAAALIRFAVLELRAARG